MSDQYTKTIILLEAGMAGCVLCNDLWAVANYLGGWPEMLKKHDWEIIGKDNLEKRYADSTLNGKKRKDICFPCECSSKSDFRDEDLNT